MTKKGNDSIKLTSWRLWMDIFHLNHHYRIYSTIFQIKNSTKHWKFSFTWDLSVVLGSGRGVPPNREKCGQRRPPKWEAHHLSRDWSEADRVIFPCILLVAPSKGLDDVCFLPVSWTDYHDLTKMIMNSLPVVSTSSLFHSWMH